ncbi:GDSL-type esterase/lipase family protein [Pelagibacterium montanilacus]|uniref:GDSL-type esterase/lipase family protein n=1 Tax=Pelagibacterium montanilacus TaxID=2185280 RepID=UPI000F8F0091|nr:GDSL-type esterase/lipase family protein [Pelagibacterium montanilacus]
MPTHNLIASTQIDPSLLQGFAELEQTEFGLLPHRLPAKARAQSSDPQMAMVESEPSGVRIAFRTAATAIEIDVLTSRRELVGVPPRPVGVFDLCIDGRLESQQSARDATILRIDMASGTVVREPAGVQTLQFNGLASREKKVEIWLPHNEITELGALRANAPIVAVTDMAKALWVHHGSSISHGSNAASPTGTWPAIAASLVGVDLMNMGFGGNALLDPFTARAIRDRPADIISVKIGINLVNADLMRLRAFGPAVHGFLDTIREGHPDTPLLVISPIYCPIHETTPGPGMFDLDALAKGEMKFVALGKEEEVGGGKLTLTVIRAHLQTIVEQRAEDDPNIHYLDGRDLYGEPDHARLPLPDRLHPDAEAHRLIGGRFAPFLQDKVLPRSVAQT